MNKWALLNELGQRWSSSRQAGQLCWAPSTGPPDALMPKRKVSATKGGAQEEIRGGGGGGGVLVSYTQSCKSGKETKKWQQERSNLQRKE